MTVAPMLKSQYRASLDLRLAAIEKSPDALETSGALQCRYRLRRSSGCYGPARLLGDSVVLSLVNCEKPGAELRCKERFRQRGLLRLLRCSKIRSHLPSRLTKTADSRIELFNAPSARCSE